MRRGYSFLQRFVIAVVKPTLLALTKRDWRGREHVPSHGGMILAANHLSWTDPLAISHFLHESGRWPVFLAKSEIFSIPVLGKLIVKIGQVPVYRHSTEAGLALGAAERALAEGACVIFYPEGTCTRDPRLWPMLGKTGVARMALTTGVPVIPLAHWGPHELLPYGEKKPRLFPRKTMRLRAGPPVDLSAYQGAELSARNLRAATNDITAAITAQLAELRGETPPDRPYDSSRDRQDTGGRGGAAASSAGSRASSGQADDPGGDAGAAPAQRATDATPGGRGEA